MQGKNWDRRDFLVQALAGGAVALSASQVQFAQTYVPTPIVATKINDHIVMFSGDVGNVVVNSGDDGLMMIDGGIAERAAELAKAIATIDPRKVRILFDTHWHFDHVGSNEFVGKNGAKIIAHESVKRRLSEGVVSRALNVMHKEPLDEKLGPLKSEGIPVETFTTGGKMTFGKERIEYAHYPLAHTDGDTYLFFPNSNMLQAGDLHFNGMYPVIDYSTGGWIGGMATACDELLKIGDENTKIIPGHGPLATKNDIRASREMLQKVYERLAKLNQKGMPLDDVIAAKPLADLDPQWAKPRSAEEFLKMAYPSLTTHKQRS